MDWIVLRFFVLPEHIILDPILQYVEEKEAQKNFLVIFVSAAEHRSWKHEAQYSGASCAPSSCIPPRR